MKEFGDKANLNLLGQTLELVWSSGPVKTIVLFLGLFFIFCFAFSFKVDPLYPFVLLSICMVAMTLYLMFLLPKRPELFQDCKTWLGFQKILMGDKESGLKEVTSELRLYQPIVKTKNISAKAKIIKEKESQK